MPSNDDHGRWKPPIVSYVYRVGDNHSIKQKEIDGIIEQVINNYVCKSEEQLLERLDQAILDIIDHHDKTKKTSATGTLI
jgi:hypothetical protein